MNTAPDFDHDVVVVGSGFGGSVAALRLAEKGWRVAVLEQGRKLTAEDFACAAEDPRALAWAPALGLRGFFAQDVLRHVGIVRGIGVGGGSLVYAGVLLEPAAAFFRDRAWASLRTDWQQELAPHYATARRMLGAATNPRQGLQDGWLQATAQRMGAAPAAPVPQGIFFGEPGVFTPDPFFGGAGPPRRGCTHCGHCITGCAQGAKNSLEHNYLHLAARLGVPILPERRVTHVQALPGGGYAVHQMHPWRRGAGLAPLRARKVVLAAGVLGTLEILFASRDRHRSLPRVSGALGEHVRTNSEAVVGVLARDPGVDVSGGTTVSSHFHADARTHITQNRFPPSYGFMRFYFGPLVDDAHPLRRAARTLAALLTQPRAATVSMRAAHWHRRVSVLTVMQQADNELRLRYRRRWLRAGGWGLSSSAGHGGRAPSYLAQANAAARAFAEVSDGLPLNNLLESVGNLSVTAHVLGGAVMAASPEHGVIDADHQVWGHPGLYVVDASAIAANVGVNPSLTIAALAERFGARFPTRC